VEFTVVPVETCTTEEILAVLTSAFARDFDSGWYHWKHVAGPWGPSTGWAARDDAGLVGVRLFVPWAVRCGADSMNIGRAMDGAVARRAQRQGVFSALVRREMQRQEGGSGTWSLLSSTSVPASREAYRRLGWTILPPIATGWRAPLRGLRHRSRVVLGDALDLGLPTLPAPSARLETVWTADALRWRLDESSGHHYDVARLVTADHPNGIAFRITRHRGVRAMVVVHGWGTRRDRARLVGGTAGRLRCGVIVEACGPGTDHERRPLITRRSTTVSLSPTTRFPPNAPRPDLLRSWRYSLADLEGVM
jgi:hypothetical protein